MPLKLKRRDGSVTPFRNSEYLPFYYFIPRSILQKCGAELNSIPRNPRMAFASREACEFIESDLFKLLIIDATAYMVWHHMGFDEHMEIYSGYDPAWKLAHCPDYWIKEMTDEGIIPTVKELYQNYNCDLGFVPEEEIDVYLRYIVPRVMKKYNMNAAIQVAEEFRCFEDFDFRNSRQKTDFYRKWYHTRAKISVESLDEIKEKYAENTDGMEWDIPDDSVNVESMVLEPIAVNEFLNTLSETDRKILTMRMDDVTLEKNAEELGFKTHSAIHKRIRKIGLAYEKFSGEDLGFSNKKII